MSVISGRSALEVEISRRAAGGVKVKGGRQLNAGTHFPFFHFPFSVACTKCKSASTATGPDIFENDDPMPALMMTLLWLMELTVMELK